MARGLATALQAALAGVSGGAAGYARYQEQERQRLREEEERKRRQAMDLITFGERAVEPGALATRAPAGGAGPVAGREAGAAPPPQSAIPMPTGPVDFGEAQRQLEQEELRPSGTTPLQIGDRTLYIPIGQRARDIKRSEQVEVAAGALADALARAEAVAGVERRQAQETSKEKELAAFNALKKYNQVTGDFDPTYGQYGEDLKDYRQIRVSRATQRTGGGGGDTIARQDDLGEAEAWWNETMATQRSSPEAAQRARRIADTFNRLRAANKRKDPREIFLGMYEAEQAAQKSRVEQAKAVAGIPQAAVDAMREPTYRPTEESIRLRGEPPKPTLSQADQWEQIVREEMAKGKTREQAEAEATARLRG